ncbi:PxKF domain-containing protein [Azohydromonas lata]|uniref:PxKF domain-containing protein n=1 Tax=Azohydromonas lata TaxID=45677 RepID=A0ABU5IQB7_9BURK|nr:PxKF domain-containing protein [Azohydromonas lata]MDZ5461099.1 PxKF domain-containing protein [Azohydromonas lata]
MKDVSCGTFHTVALKRDGTVVAWGWNGLGQTDVPAGLNHVRAIAAGDGHTVALKDDGTVVAWGDNSQGETTVPAGLSGVRAIAAGYRYTAALKDDGTVVAWGDNSQGQTSVPAGLNNVRAISIGTLYTVALKRDGTVVAWGWNETGQANVPAGLHNAMGVAAGAHFTMALKSNYEFGGLLGPVNAPPVVNTLEAGVAVPVRFSLGGDQGSDIFAGNYPRSRMVACRADARTDELEQAATVDHSSLKYDAAGKVYTYFWKTDPTWSGQCRRLALRFADGIERTALFQFR